MELLMPMLSASSLASDPLVSFISGDIYHHLEKTKFQFLQVLWPSVVATLMA